MHARRFPAVSVSLDGQPIVELAAESIVSRRSLHEAVGGKAGDQATWRVLEAVALDGRDVWISHLPERFGNHDIDLFSDPKHGPSLGIFVRVKPGAAPHLIASARKPRQGLVGVTAIRLWTKERPTKQEPTRRALGVEVGGKAAPSLMPKELAKLKRIAPFEGKAVRGKRNRGWPVREIVALRVAVSQVKELTVHGADGAQLQLTRSQLLDERRIALIRYNHRGDANVGIWDRDLSARTERMRRVLRLEIALEPNARARKAPTASPKRSD